MSNPYNIGRVHSAKIRSLFKIAPTGVDIIIQKGKRQIGIEIKETNGKIAKYCIKPKDMIANIFLFYYAPRNLFLLVKRRNLRKVENIVATSFSLSQVIHWSYFQTTEDNQIVEAIQNLF